MVDLYLRLLHDFRITFGIEIIMTSGFGSKSDNFFILDSIKSRAILIRSTLKEFCFWVKGLKSFEVKTSLYLMSISVFKFESFPNPGNGHFLRLLSNILVFNFMHRFSIWRVDSDEPINPTFIVLNFFIN